MRDAGRAPARRAIATSSRPDARWQFTGIRLARIGEARDDRSTPPPSRCTTVDPDSDVACATVLAGLRRGRRRCRASYFYDERGSRLFERICELDEYYLTRTELAIMREHGARDGRRSSGARACLIEYGSGSQHEDAPAARQPAPAGGLRADRHLARCACSRRARSARASTIRDLDVLPVCADYQRSRFELPRPRAGRRATSSSSPARPSATSSPARPRVLLAAMRAPRAARGGALLIGVDLKKDRATLERAYNDARGVTAEFNLNMLVRLNRELDADLRPRRLPPSRHLRTSAAAASRCIS